MNNSFIRDSFSLYVYWNHISYLGCIDTEVDCDECEYCNEERRECRTIFCNCMLPSLSTDHRFIFKDENKNYNRNNMTEVNHAHFVSLSAARCKEEAEVECSDGYVYFDPNAKVW